MSASSAALDPEGARITSLIEAGETALGIELGSTRIKAVLVDGAGKPIAFGSHSWENWLTNGLW